MTTEDTKPAPIAGRPPAKKVRKNGWTFPLHPLQFMAWFFFLYFLFTLFTLFIPNLPTSCDRILCYTFGGLIFLVHFIIHILSVSSNPADEGVTEKYDARRGSKIFPLGTFDKSKHEHVIENQFCYICEVSVSSRAKHCSVCNKCVHTFDHHCKWLNNCVGGKNYRLFLTCVVSAFLGSLTVLSVSIAMIVAYFSLSNDRTKVSERLANGASSTTNSTSSTVSSSNGNTSFILYTTFGVSTDESDHHVWISVVILTAILSTISFLLLGHLLLFHMYLYLNKMSTYDFIMKRRREQIQSSSEDNNNEKQNQERRGAAAAALLSTSYFFACCSTKIERMKKGRNRKVHDIRSDSKNFQNGKKKKNNKWFRRNISTVRRGSKVQDSQICYSGNGIESIDGQINNTNPNGGLLNGSNVMSNVTTTFGKRTSIDSLPTWNGTLHGDVYIGSPERRLTERATRDKKEVADGSEDGERSKKVVLNKRLSDLSIQTSSSDPFTSPGPYSIPVLGSAIQKEEKVDERANKRRSSEILTTESRNFFNEQQRSTSFVPQQLPPNTSDRKINSSSDRNHLVSRLCDRSKSVQLESAGLHKRMRRDSAKLQHQLMFRQKSIEQMINSQKRFHQLPGIRSLDGDLDISNSRLSNDNGSVIFVDPETCDDNDETNEIVFPART